MNVGVSNPRPSFSHRPEVCACIFSMLMALIWIKNHVASSRRHLLTSVSEHIVYIWCVPSSLGRSFDFIASLSLLILKPNSQSECTLLLTTHHVPPMGLALDVVMVVGLSPHLSCPSGDGGTGQSRLLASPDVMFSVPGQEVFFTPFQIISNIWAE